jgi:RNA polymerase sigma-70 factor (sigma-E family)
VTFDEFVAARLPALLRYAMVITGDHHVAEDVVQDALVRAQSRWSRIAATERPEAYVKRIVLNEYLSWRRRLRTTRSIPTPDEMIEQAAGPMGDPTGAVAERDAVVALIAGLPPRQRAVLALRYYEGLSDAEIADLLGCAEATVRSHAARALTALRRPATTTALNGG